MNKEKVISSGILEQYVLGLTSPKENAEVEAAIEKYPEVRAQVEALQSGIESYAISHNITPNVIAQKVQKKFTTLVIFLLILLMSLAVLCWRFYERKETALAEVGELKQELYLLKERYNILALEDEQIREEVVLLQDTATRRIPLEGKAFHQASMTVYWNDRLKNALLQLVNIPPPPQNRKYCLWGEQDGIHKKLGVVKNIKKGISNFPIHYLQGCQSISVTLEREETVSRPDTQNLFARCSF